MLRRIDNELKRFFKRRIYRPFWLNKVRNEPWKKVLDETREEVANNSHISYAEIYEKQEIWFWTEILKWFYEDSRKNNFSKILDAGLAYGTLSIYAKKLTNAQMFAIDLSDEFFNKTLKKKFEINLIACNIDKDPIPWDHKFDAIIFTEIFEHLSCHPLPALLKLKNSLSDNGIIYLSTPDAKDYGRITDYFKSYKEMPYEGEAIDKTGTTHVYHYSKEEMIELFDEAGLIVEKFDYSPGITYRHLNFALKKKY